MPIKEGFDRNDAHMKFFVVYGHVGRQHEKSGLFRMPSPTNLKISLLFCICVIQYIYRKGI